MCFVVCVNSWMVLRSQCVDDESTLTPAAETERGRNDNKNNCPAANVNEWCSDADDWDADDNDACCADETSADDINLSSSQFVSHATNVDHNDILSAAVPVLQDTSPSSNVKPSDLSSDEPVQLLTQLTIGNESEKLVSTQNKASTSIQRQFVSDVKGESLNTSRESTITVESTLNVSAELEPYYIYVTEDSSPPDHSDHVEDLLTRYALQEGSSFRAALEPGNAAYVTRNQ